MHNAFVDGVFRTYPLALSDDDTNVTIELVKPVELWFSIDIFSRFTKCPARSRTVTIYMAHDTPICVRTA